MAGKFSLGNKGWLLIILPLGVALALLALNYGADRGGENMTELEARLSATLSDMEGAGKVRAMVLADASAGIGEASGKQNVRGVIIVAQGAYDLGVRLKLQRAAMTLFSLPAEQVEVFSGQEENEK